MKFIILTVLISLSLNFYGEQNGNHKVTIQGELRGFNNGDTLLLSLGDGNVSRLKDTIIVKDNKFHHKLEVPYVPIRVILSSTDIFGRKMFWLGSENIIIRGKKESFDEAEIIGSTFQSEDENFHLEFKNAKTLNDKEKIIFSYPIAPSALKEIYKLKDRLPDSRLEQFYNILSEALKKHDFGVKLNNYLALEEKKELKIGDEIYDFIAFDEQGNKFILSENLNNKYTLLEFRSAYCFSSLKNIPEINNLIQNHGDRIQVITFSIDTKPSSWKEIKEDECKSLKIWDGKGEIGKPCIKYGITGTPFLFVISPEGIIIDKWFGYSKGLILDKWKDLESKK